MGCYIKQFPDGCFETGGCISHIIAWVYGGAPLLFTMVSLPIINFVIFLHVRRVLRRPAPNEASPAQVEQIKEVASQGLLYVFSFYFSYTAALVVKGAESFEVDKEVEDDWYWILILSSGLPPLQGLFNMFVYIRPNWKRLRSAYPGNKFTWYLRGVIVDPDVPSLATTHKKTQKNVNSNTGNRKTDLRSASVKRGSNFSSSLPQIKEENDENQQEASEVGESLSLDGNDLAFVNHQQVIASPNQAVMSPRATTPRRISMDGSVNGTFSD